MYARVKFTDSWQETTYMVVELKPGVSFGETLGDDTFDPPGFDVHVYATEAEAEAANALDARVKP